MKLKLAIGYNVARQRESVASIKIPRKLAHAIVTDHFNNMDYKERQSWLTKNNVKIESSNLI